MTVGELKAILSGVDDNLNVSYAKKFENIGEVFNATNDIDDVIVIAKSFNIGEGVYIVGN